MRLGNLQYFTPLAMSCKVHWGQHLSELKRIMNITAKYSRTTVNINEGTRLFEEQFFGRVHYFSWTHKQRQTPGLSHILNGVFHVVNNSVVVLLIAPYWVSKENVV